MCYEIGVQTHAAAGLLKLFCFPGTSIHELYADTVMSDAELFDDFGLEPVEDGLMSPIISTQNSEDQSSTQAPSSSTPVRRSEHHDARFRKKTFRERTQQKMK